MAINKKREKFGYLALPIMIEGLNEDDGEKVVFT